MNEWFKFMRIHLQFKSRKQIWTSTFKNPESASFNTFIQIWKKASLKSVGKCLY